MYQNWVDIDSRMSCRLDEVQASMDTVIHNFLSVDTTFLFEVGIKTRLDVLDNWFPANLKSITFSYRSRRATLPFVVIDKVTETGRINNGQTQSNTILLNIWKSKNLLVSKFISNYYNRLTSTDTLDRNGLWAFCMRRERLLPGV